MKSDAFAQHLLRLKLSPAEAADLLGVSSRTVRRWIEGEEAPGPVKQAIIAWTRLEDLRLPWRPDSASITFKDQKQIDLHRHLAVELDEVLQRVQARGGAKLPWRVDWDWGTAELGPMSITFYKLQNGGFSVGTYRRTDRAADKQRDQEMLEDAVWCIAEALRRKRPDFGPVVLVYHDGPARGRVASQKIENHETANAAVARACKEAIGSRGFHSPVITTESLNDVLWTTEELKRECVRRTSGPAALAELASYVHRHCDVFAQSGSVALDRQAANDRQNRIKVLAEEIQGLSAQASQGLVQYQHFEQVLGSLHAAGFYPPNSLVESVARALEGLPK